VASAEFLFVQPAAESRQYIQKQDVFGGPGESVSTGLPARAGHQTALPQHLQDLPGVRHGDALAAAHRGDRENSFGPLLPHLQEAAQAVLIIGGQFHSVLTGSSI
jgi:hypothetical protein